MGVIADSVRENNIDIVLKRKHIMGWGIRDTKEPIVKGYYVGSKWVETWRCPIYVDWKTMIYRALSEEFHKRKPSYKGTTIEPSWQYFSNFYEWVMTQPCKDWMNMSLDKDLIDPKRKHYGPETCAYVPQSINTFFNLKKEIRGNLLVGVSLNGSKKRPYQVYISDPTTGRNKNLGRFETEIEAHLTWKAYKHYLALGYIGLGLDSRIEKLLMTKFSPESDLTKA